YFHGFGETLLRVFARLPRLCPPAGEYPELRGDRRPQSRFARLHHPGRRRLRGGSVDLRIDRDRLPLSELRQSRDFADQWLIVFRQGYLARNEADDGDVLGRTFGR